MSKIGRLCDEKFLITGSSGFIGSNLINRARQLGLQVLGIDVESPIENNLDIHVRCDLKDYYGLKKVIDEYEPTIIIHLAARTDLNGSCLEDYSDNTLAVDNLCKVVLDTSSCKRILFASSMLVCPPGYEPKSFDDYCPATIYGESKVVTETIINSYSDRLPEHIIFRPTSIWGPYFKEPYRDFFDMVLSRRYLRIGGCFAKKTYGYVENSCNQILSLSCCEFFERVYYLGDEPLNANDWSVLIASEAGIREPIEFPFFVIKLASLFGDVLSKLGLKFPLTSFRLNNMMTNNIYDPLPITSINIFKKIPLEKGVSHTINFLKTDNVIHL